MSRPGGTSWTGWLWTAPWWLGFLLFLAGPLVISLYISLCDYPLLQPPVYVGLENYRRLAHDPLFARVVFNTCVYAALAIPATTVLAILLAVLLNQPVRGQAIWRACVFVPTVVPMVAVGVVWLWLLNPRLGPVNAILRAIGLDSPLWLDSPELAMPSLVLVSLWMVGSPVMIYLAGLQDIPESLYEAARLDGAGTLRQFWHITLPGLSPVILFNVIMGLIGAWQVFALPYVLWGGGRGPEATVYFYTMYLFDAAFRFLQMGYASAMAWVQFVIILALTGLTFAVSRRMVFYQGAK